MFLLTHEHQSLVREITTPSLAPFITAALNTVSSPTSSQAGRAFLGQSSLLLVVLQAFSELIILHPTSFRPYIQQIQTLVNPLIAQTWSSFEIEENAVSESAIQEAQRLFALLHVCAPKNTAAEEWSRSLQTVILSAQRTADKIFRGFVEDRRQRTEKSGLADNEIGETVVDRKPQPLALPGWVGINAGVERLDGLLGLVQAFLSSETSTAVTTPISNIVGLVYRILSVLQSDSSRNSRIRPEISRDEREGLEVGLPRIHVSALAILSRLMLRVGSGFNATLQRSIDYMLWVMEIQYSSEKIRKVVYTTMSQILTEFGPTLPTSCATPIARCVRQCCEDLLTSHDPSILEGQNLSSKGVAQTDNKPSVTNADAYLKAAATGVRATNVSAAVVAAAEMLLPLTLTSLPPGYLSLAVRTRVDRTAILTDNKTAMLASVISPPVGNKGQQSMISIMPMLARAHSDNFGFEALIRPQMPVIHFRGTAGEESTPDEEEEIQLHEKSSDRLHNDFPANRLGFSRGDASNDDLIEAVNGDIENLSRVGILKDDSVPATNGGNMPTADLPPPTENWPHTPSKRARDLGEPDALTMPNPLTVEEVSSSKRPRLISEGAEQEPKPGDSGVVTSAVNDQPSRAAEPPSFMPEAVSEVKPVDSDESDFEMPTLYLEDSDEEDLEEKGGEEDDD